MQHLNFESQAGGTFKQSRSFFETRPRVMFTHPEPHAQHGSTGRQATGGNVKPLVNGNRSAAILAIHLLAVCLAASSCIDPQTSPAEVTVSHVPETVYTSVQGVSFQHLPSVPKDAHAESQNLTWLFHLVFQSHSSRPLSFQGVEMTFLKEGKDLWKESYSRDYLQHLEWIEGAFEMTTEYFLSNIEFVDNVMSVKEIATAPELPPGQAVSWVRIPFARPWFADIDRIDFAFTLHDSENREQRLEHSVPIVRHSQQVRLQLPFSGVWAVNKGNDLSTGHRRTGLNGLTTYAWDFLKVGENGFPYRTSGETPEDYHAYGEPVLAAAAGTVVHVRNDIPDFGVGEVPPLELLEQDGDVHAGNLVVLDHGNGEFTLTCHMKPGTIPVAIGDHVEAGQFIGETGNSGNSQIPHIHFNLMTGGDWLQARGLPALFYDFEQIRTGGPPLAVAAGNPISGWLVRALSESRGRGH